MKRKIFKLITGLVLALAMLLTMLPVSAVTTKADEWNFFYIKIDNLYPGETVNNVSFRVDAYHYGDPISSSVLTITDWWILNKNGKQLAQTDTLTPGETVTVYLEFTLASGYETVRSRVHFYKPGGMDLDLDYYNKTGSTYTIARTLTISQPVTTITLKAQNGSVADIIPLAGKAAPAIVPYTNLNFTVKEYRWFDLEEDETITSFETNTWVGLDVTLEADSGYEFGPLCEIKHTNDALDEAFAGKYDSESKPGKIVTLSYAFTIMAEPTGLYLQAGNTATLDVGGTRNMIAVYEPDDAFTRHPEITWTSSNPAVVTISETAADNAVTIKGVAAGTSIVTASITNSFGNTYKAECVVSVSAGGWIKTADGKWMYYVNGGPVIGWKMIDNVWYYFNASGIMMTSWQQIGDKWYYFGGNGAMVTSWQQIGGKWYYFGSNGAMATGWQQLGGAWYYFGSNGAMATGWQQISGAWYYFGGNGVMATGWKQLGGAWYYFSGNGKMATGWVQSGSNWYYMKSNGVMATGWIQVGNDWYYLNAAGIVQTGWRQEGNNWYYLKSNGTMATSWQQISGAWYYFGGNGIMATGWQQIGGSWFYFGSNGVLAIGWRQLGETWYYFKGNGAMATGWLQINNVWYYFQSNGAMVYNTTITINGVNYTFNASGAWVG